MKTLQVLCLLLGCTLLTLVIGAGFPTIPGTLIADHVAAGIYGGAVHDDGDVIDGADVCSAATYSGCGNGVCGVKNQRDIAGVGNKDSKENTAVCSTKDCGGVSISCGSINGWKCQ
jgi:hypothetical protein